MDSMANARGYVLRVVFDERVAVDDHLRDLETLHVRLGEVLAAADVLVGWRPAGVRTSWVRVAVQDGSIVSTWNCPVCWQVITGFDGKPASMLQTLADHQSCELVTDDDTIELDAVTEPPNPGGLGDVLPNFAALAALLDDEDENDRLVDPYDFLNDAMIDDEDKVIGEVLTRVR